MKSPEKLSKKSPQNNFPYKYNRDDQKNARIINKTINSSGPIGYSY